MAENVSTRQIKTQQPETKFAAKTDENFAIQENTFFNSEIVRMQGKVGNAAVQRLMRSGQLRSTLHIQRDEAAPAAAPAARSVTVDGVSISTYDQAASWYSERVLRLMGVKQDFDGELAPPQELSDAILDGKDFASVASLKSGQMEDQDLNDLTDWCKAYIAANNIAQGALAVHVSDKMTESKDKSSDVQAKMTEVVAALRDLQREVFRKEDEDGLLKITDAIAGVLDCSLAAKDSIDAITDALAELRPWRMDLELTKLVPPVKSKLPKILDTLEKVNKVYAVFQVARAGIDAIKGGKTKVAETISGIQGVATLASAGGTILGCSAMFGLYANLYIGPIVEQCTALLGVISEALSKEHNRLMIENGQFDAVIWSLEPGGRAVFNFMLLTMRAKSHNGVPTYIPEEVSEFFVDNDDELNAGVGYDEDNEEDQKKQDGEEGSAVPTTGWIFKDVDRTKIRKWVFNNRQNIWAMLYGNCQVPGKG